MLLAGAGMVFDLVGESVSALLLVAWAPATADALAAPAAASAAFASAERVATLLTAGAANGLYTLGGFVLMLTTPDLHRWVRCAMWGTWSVGVAMTLAALAGSTGGLVVSTPLLFLLFIVWVAWMGTYWRREPAPLPVPGLY